MMRVLIAGGSGLIGRALALDLVKDGVDVIILSRRPDQVKELPVEVRVTGWDGQSFEGWLSLADGADAVINLAGENIGSRRWTAERKKALTESRLNAGRVITKAIESLPHKPRILVQASGIGYYGPHGDEEISENAHSGNDYLSELARHWEASTAGVEALGVRRVTIRTGVVLSTQGGALPRMALPFRFFIGGRLGTGRQWLPWIHITDEVAAIRFLIENESAKGPFNLASPNPVTNAEFARLLGKRLHRPSIVPTPAFAIKLILGEMSTVVLDGQRAFPSRLLGLGFNFRFNDAGLALDDLLGQKENG